MATNDTSTADTEKAHQHRMLLKIGRPWVLALAIALAVGLTGLVLVRIGGLV